MGATRFETKSESGVVISVKKGDLTTESVDCIVNAANEHLAHGGGLAGAIVRAGGEVIQRESREIAPVPTGGAASTGAGSLPCKRVIHAVGPIWGRQSPEDSDRLLASAVTSALRVADEEGLTSISIPAISSGIFGFPKDRCARVMFDALDGYLRGHRQTVLREVDFCNFDEPTVAIFEAEAQRRYGAL